MRSYLVVHPAGGSNPGMIMHNKRWLPANFAALITALRDDLATEVVLIAGPGDEPIIEAVQSHMECPIPAFVGLTFGQVAALAKNAVAYIGNDTGLTHLAAAAGAKTVMILGPSDPVRYAPFTPDSLALWKPVQLHSGGVAFDSMSEWDWMRDGIQTDEVIERVLTFLRL